MESHFINDAPFWTQEDGNNAIWHDGENNWRVGPFSDRGTTYGGLKAKSDDICVHDINYSWYYYDKSWHKAEKGAFVDCAPLNIGM